MSIHESWFGKTGSEATRFHHRILPPEGDLAGWHIVSTGKYSSPQPAITGQYWNLGMEQGKDAVIGINLMEYANIVEAHREIISMLKSFTMRGLDFSPQSNAPGDVLILNIMGRDNIRINIASVDPLNRNTERHLLKRVDEWLIGNWPLQVSKAKAANPQPLVINIRPQNPSVAIGKSIELLIEVVMNGSKLELKDLPHRFLANPGRIAWKDNRYFFIAGRAGQSEITLDIVGPKGEYGHGSVTLKVKKE
jgi:hypothetical protein